MNIPNESYQHVYAHDRMKAEEAIKRNEAIFRNLTEQDNRLESVELENHKLRFALIVAISYGAYITLKLWGIV